MPRDDETPGLRQEAIPKDLAESGAGDAMSEDLSQEHRPMREIELAELRRLAEEGKASGLSEEDGEALIARLQAKYRSLVGRKSGA